MLHSKTFVVLLLFILPDIISAKEHKVKNFHQNVIWTTPSQNASESMPLGGGDIGCNIWVENGDLLIYAQRSGAFSEQGEYLKMGRIRVKMSHDPFVGFNSFHQEQNLVDGNVLIKSEKSGIKTEIILWVDLFNHSVHIKTTTSVPTLMEATYENWRTDERQLIDNAQRRDRFSCFQFEHAPFSTIKRADSVKYHKDAVLFYHQNREKSDSPHLMIEELGLQKWATDIPDYNSNKISGGMLWGKHFVVGKQSKGIYGKTPYQAWSIISSDKNTMHKVVLSTHIAQVDHINKWKSHLYHNRRIDEKNRGSLSKNQAWWQRFWQRSWIIVDPFQKEEDKSYWIMGRNYQLFRSQLGGNLYGAYPTKFNGGNLTIDPCFINPQMDYDPDWRQWGGDVFTMQNQRLLYWPMLKSGDTDGIHPELDLYVKALDGAMIKTKQLLGHEGAMFTEYMHSSGMDMPSAWGWSKEDDPQSRVRGREIPLGDPRATATTTYGSIVEQGMLANGSIAYHWEAQVEHAYLALEMFRYTGKDIAPYLPFIKESLMFFDKHYQLRQKLRNGNTEDENGKLVFYPSTACESYRGAKNPTDLVSGLHASITALLQYPKGWLTKDQERYFESYLNRLPSISFGISNGDSIVLPAESYVKYQNVECPQFYPLFPFNQYEMSDPEISYFRNAWKHGNFPKNIVQSWHQDGIFYARMGMIEEASSYNRQKLANSQRRFPTYWGPGHDWVPDHNWGGSGMIGLQEMLLQTVGDRIEILPCWPKNKDVIFKLHAPHQTTVEVEYINGKIIKCDVHPASRRKDVVIKI